MALSAARSSVVGDRMRGRHCQRFCRCHSLVARASLTGLWGRPSPSPRNAPAQTYRGFSFWRAYIKNCGCGERSRRADHQPAPSAFGEPCCGTCAKVEHGMKRALVCGAGGFIGSHLVKRLKREGLFVRGVDLKYPRFSQSEADDFIVGDLRDLKTCQNVVDCRFDDLSTRSRHGRRRLYLHRRERRRRYAQLSADQSQYARGVPPP
jgi:NAD dependent epimerase/dehydratase family